MTRHLDIWSALMIILTGLSLAASCLALPANESLITDPTPDFTWSWTDNATTNYTLIIDDSSDLATPIRTITDITGTSYTLTAPEELTVDTTYYWKVDVYVSGILTDSIGTSWFKLDTTEPAITGFIPGNNTIINSSTIMIFMTTDENASCRYSTNPGIVWGSMTAMADTATQHTTTLNLGSQGNNHFYFLCQDTAGNLMTTRNNYTLFLDSIDPVPGTVTINTGVAYTNGATLTVTWNGFTDSGTSITHYYLNYTDRSGTRTATIYPNTTTSAIIPNDVEGNRTVYVWAEDSAENIGAAASDSIIVDWTAPIFDSWSESPSNLRYDHTGDLNITMTMDEPNMNSVPQCRYRWGSAAYSAWQDTTHITGQDYMFAITQTWSDHAGEYMYYECRAYDMVNYMSNETRTKYILANSNPPTIKDLPGIMQAEEDANFSFTITGEDLDMDSITFGSDYPFVFRQIDDTHAEASWVPGNEYTGLNTVNFTVTDGTFTRGYITTINVTGTNDAPIINTIGTLEAYLHEPFSIYITATDPDNENNATEDDDMAGIFSSSVSWFRIQSAFNYSDKRFYGLINITPLTSQTGRHNISITITDGKDSDQEYVIFNVGYCGDKDDAGEPKCDSVYEDCSTCPQDCGECEIEEKRSMAIITDARNCLYRNFTMAAYELFKRARCDVEGEIINGQEVCRNISDATITVYQLRNREWEKIDDFVTDSNGRVSFVPQIEGSYKLVAEYKNYVKAVKYIDFKECIDIKKQVETANNTEEKILPPPKAKSNTTKAKKEDMPDIIEEPEYIEGTDVKEASVLTIIIFYVIIPIFLVAIIVLTYIYYQKEKNNKVWILKTRIWIMEKTKKLKIKLKRYNMKIKDILGY